MESITKEHNTHGNSNGNRQGLEHPYIDRPLQMQRPCMNCIVQAWPEEALDREKTLEKGDRVKLSSEQMFWIRTLILHQQ